MIQPRRARASVASSRVAPARRFDAPESAEPSPARNRNAGEASPPMKISQWNAVRSRSASRVQESTTWASTIATTATPRAQSSQAIRPAWRTGSVRARPRTTS